MKRLASMQFAERKAVDQRVGIGHGRQIGRGRGERDVIAELPRLGGERHRDRARAEDDQRRMRQHRLDEDVHGALARAHVAGEAHAVAVLAGLDAEFGQQIFRLHRHHARLAIGKRLARRLQHRAAGAAAADPARHDGAVGTDDRLGAGLGRGHRHGAHHGGEHEGLLGGLELRHQIHHFDMSGHRSPLRASPDRVRARPGFSAYWPAHRDRHAAAPP